MQFWPSFNRNHQRATLRRRLLIRSRLSGRSVEPTDSNMIQGETSFYTCSKLLASARNYFSSGYECDSGVDMQADTTAYVSSQQNLHHAKNRAGRPTLITLATTTKCLLALAHAHRYHFAPYARIRILRLSLSARTPKLKRIEL